MFDAKLRYGRDLIGVTLTLVGRGKQGSELSEVSAEGRCIDGATAGRGVTLQLPFSNLRKLGSPVLYLHAEGTTARYPVALTTVPFLYVSSTS